MPEAGPAVIVSFILAGITAALTAVCYAELASTIPVSGSSYSYTYATMGEIVAFGVAACLLLEYGVSSAAVGWAQYLDELFSTLFGFRIPDAMLAAPGEDALDSLPGEAGEVLVVGSSRLGPIARVFLGSNSTKIVRSLPVLVIPRGADVHLEENAPTSV